ncbi:MAG: dioxygenase, partial [Deltaproteobacteria bacterium]|nr:dioxygenase [Deltaproteobacteria bacterium]
MTKPFPTIFVSHGAPTLLIDPGPTHDFLKELGRIIGKPKAIVCVSAHWTTREPKVNSGSRLETIYDFYGFPEELYEITYPAPGEPALANRVSMLLREAGIEVSADAHRGIDHGAWV